ncbi:MAG TPA: type II toxin-antitoxin system VapC family toxin [Thermoanaerobaculia bacterium]|nr:type II toxin-antitoxin system VapC family toxin [Thermoanaerobaculia bacterium]
MVAVDTNVVVRLFIRDDEPQVAIAEEFIQKGGWVSYIVVVEMAWVLGGTYGLSDAEIARIVEMLLEHDKLTLQDSDTVAAALDHYRRKPSLGLADCLILEIARKAGHLPLGTFDRDLAKLPSAHRL